MLTPRYQLHREQLIARPLDEVFAFFANAGNLERITPTFLHFRILPPLPISMEAGAAIAYRLRLFGVSFDWLTHIVLFEPERRFIDRQIAGPYRLWHHLHEFQAVKGGTLMRDVVDYELPLGPLGVLAHGLWVRRTLDRIFDYRRDQVAAIFGA
jgi:ligand-binding SRPBCC domain-containing protein